MNPFESLKQSIFVSEPTGVEGSALYVILSQAAASYSSGFTRGPGNNEAQYAIRTLEASFPNSPAVAALKKLAGVRLAQ